MIIFQNVLGTITEVNNFAFKGYIVLKLSYGFLRAGVTGKADLKANSISRKNKYEFRIIIGRYDVSVAKKTDQSESVFKHLVGFVSFNRFFAYYPDLKQ